MSSVELAERPPHAVWPVDVDELYGCWRWKGKRDRDGYGRIWRGNKRPELAHRVVYEHHKGPIDAGRELDHLCRRRDCVRPEHLEPVTRRENVRRLHWRNRVGHKACSAGHDTFTNCRRTPEGGIVCLVCSGIKAFPMDMDNEFESGSVNFKPDGTRRNSAVAGVLVHFRYAHLPPHLQKVSKPIGELAVQLANTLPESPELTVGLRKFLEGKDCAVRAAVCANQS